MEFALNEEDVPEAFYEPSKKQYADAKVSMLELRLKQLLLQRDQILNKSGIDSKRLEDVEIRIECAEIELETAKYEAFRLCAEV